MATVINTTPATSEDSGAGWAVALVVLAAAVIIGLFVWPGFVRNSAAPAGTTNIDVSVPTPSIPAPSADGGASGGTGGEGTTP